jgi:glucosamine--fructose-6-phosphate aminotransferase (isomerizing)
MSYETYTWREIQSQPQVWPHVLDVVRANAAELRALFTDRPFGAIVVTGCGSTYYLAVAAASLLQTLTGVPSRGVPASEIWLDGDAVFARGQRALLIAVSRSGETTETQRAVEAFRARGDGAVLSLSCYPGRPLSQMGDLNLLFAEAQEESVAQTRAFSSLYLATAALAALWAGRDDLLADLALLPAAAQAMLEDSLALAQRLARDLALKRIFFLGSGARYGLACELSLKMKEMSLSDSEPFHFLEFRHGPQSMAGPEALIVGLLSETNRAHEQAVLDEMRAHGATVVAIGPGGDVPFTTDAGELARGALYLPFGQMLAYERAVWRGLNPDRPHNLDAVVRLDTLPAST